VGAALRRRETPGVPEEDVGGGDHQALGARREVLPGSEVADGVRIHVVGGEKLAVFGGMLGGVGRDIVLRPLHLGGSPENADEVALVEDGALPAHQHVEALGDPDLQGLDGAGQPLLRHRLHQQVEVVRLDAEAHYPEPVHLADGHQGRGDDTEAALGAEVPHVVEEGEVHVEWHEPRRHRPRVVVDGVALPRPPRTFPRPPRFE
jgi:hypothetical protein